jgi:DNA-binding transcriptional MerR regulator
MELDEGGDEVALRRALQAKERDLLLAAELGMQLSEQNERLRAKLEHAEADLESSRCTTRESERRAQRTIAELLEKQQQLEAQLHESMASSYSHSSTPQPTHLVVSPVRSPINWSRADASSPALDRSELTVPAGSRSMCSVAVSTDDLCSPTNFDSPTGMGFRRLDVNDSTLSQPSALSPDSLISTSMFSPVPSIAPYRPQSHSVLKMRTRSLQEDLESVEASLAAADRDRAALRQQLDDARAQVAQLTQQLQIALQPIEPVLVAPALPITPPRCFVAKSQQCSPFVFPSQHTHISYSSFVCYTESIARLMNVEFFASSTAPLTLMSVGEAPGQTPAELTSRTLLQDIVDNGDEVPSAAKLDSPLPSRLRKRIVAASSPEIAKVEPRSAQAVAEPKSSWLAHVFQMCRRK